MSSVARRRCRKASRSCRRASRRRRPPPPPTPPSRKWPGGQKLQVRMMLVQKQLQTKQRPATQSKIQDIWNNDQSRKSQVFPRLPQTWESRTRRPWRSAASSWSWCQVGADLHVEVELDAVVDVVDACRDNCSSFLHQAWRRRKNYDPMAAAGKKKEVRDHCLPFSILTTMMSDVDSIDGRCQQWQQWQ